MKITSVNTSNNNNFKSGLTKNLIQEFSQINVRQAEIELAKTGIQANFLENQNICGCVLKVVKIFQDLKDKYHLSLEFTPPNIRVFKPNEITENFLAYRRGFCLAENSKIIFDEDEYKTNSIFLNKKLGNLHIQNIFNTLRYILSAGSSSLFMSTILHESFHCAHMDLIFRKFGYDGEDDTLKEKYKKENPMGYEVIDRLVAPGFDKKEKVYIFHNFGDYALDERGGFMETFAEIMVSLIERSLDKNLELIKNPMDTLPKKCPENLKKMLENNLYL